jgi:hypothetical protein
MDILPLPLTKDTTINYEPISTKYEFEQSSKFDYATSAIRVKPGKSVQINTYMPIASFQILDDFIMSWDGQPVMWQGFTWFIESYQCDYTGEGNSGRVSISLVSINN